MSLCQAPGGLLHATYAVTGQRAPQYSLASTSKRPFAFFSFLKALHFRLLLKTHLQNAFLIGSFNPQKFREVSNVQDQRFQGLLNPQHKGGWAIAEVTRKQLNCNICAYPTHLKGLLLSGPQDRTQRTKGSEKPAFKSLST